MRKAISLSVLFLLISCSPTRIVKGIAADKAEEKKHEVESELAKHLKKYDKSIEDFDKNDNGTLDSDEELEVLEFVSKREGLEFSLEQLGDVKDDIISNIKSGKGLKESFISAFKEKLEEGKNFDWHKLTETSTFLAILVFLFNRLIGWLRSGWKDEE